MGIILSHKLSLIGTNLKLSWASVKPYVQRLQIEAHALSICGEEHDKARRNGPRREIPARPR
jgi:hypothetical protein